METLEKQSLNNAIYTFKDELTAIEDGDTAYIYFSKHRITRLIRQGILKVRNTGKGRVTELTSEARILLEAEGNQ